MAAAAARQRYTTSWWWIILPPLFREVVVVLLLVLLLCFCLAWILEGNIKTAPVEVSSKVWLATVVTWTLMLPSFARKKQTTTPSLRDATMLFSMSPTFGLLSWLLFMTPRIIIMFPSCKSPPPTPHQRVDFH